MLYHNGIIVFYNQGCQLVKNKEIMDSLILSNKDKKFFKDTFILNNFFKNFINKTVYYDPLRHCFLKKNNKTIENMQSYTINNYGFRCDNFYLNSKTDILFAGCSETFGQGGSLEQGWSFMLNKHFNINNYFNVALPGAGYQQIIHNCLHYIEHFNKPKNLFIVFPNIERHILYNYLPKPKIKKQALSHYEFDLKKKPGYHPWPLRSTHEEFSPYPDELKDNEFSYKTKIFEFYQLLTILEKNMKLLNINFWWTLDRNIDRQNIYNINTFNNFINYSFDDLVKFIVEYKIKNKNIKNIEWKVDGHAGVGIHEFWKNLFLNKVII